MELAAKLGIERAWTGLWLGEPTVRCTSDRPEHRIRAFLAGLACGLRGIAAGNQWLRNDTAIRRLCDDRFPDQGTIHRWLEDVSPPQVLELRRHLQESVRQHGRFRHQLGLPGGIIVDVDAQGIVAAGQRWELAELHLPPATAPTRPREAWVRGDQLDLSAVLERSRYSGVRFRADPDRGAVIAEDTLGTPESAAWSRWLKRPVQRLLLLAG